MARETQKKVSLDQADWDVLFKSKEYTIGSTVLKIYPLSLEELISVVKTFAVIQKEAATIQELVTPRYDEEGNPVPRDSSILENLAQVIMEKAPSILSTMSGLNVDDVIGLPLLEAVKLFNACVDVNLESQEDLVKNLKALGQKVSTLTGAQSDMQSKS